MPGEVTLADVGSLLRNSFGATLSEVINVISHPKLADIIDIIIVAFLVYEVITLVKQTRAAQLMKGILVLFLAFFGSAVFQLRTLNFLLQQVLQFGALALVVIFQPELRRALEQMGRTNIFSFSFFKTHTVDEQVREQWQTAIATVCDAVEQMSDSRTGALIVFERRSNLGEIIKTGTVLNADINVEAIGTIFYEGTPLHDGAVVVRDARIKAAGCVLPLSANLEISKDMGTRHRAALGMSENSDAICVVVSEETGIVSLAKNGVLIRRLDRQNLFSLLKSELVPELPKTEEKKKKSFRIKRKKGGDDHGKKAE
ncbi:MAG: diadenylate cyclase CdaA [Pygmaiobacter massiliensis]